MQLLLSLLIVAASPAPAEPNLPHAHELFRCRFDAASDKNLDEWPDGWVRRRGPGFPQYISIKLAEERPGEGPAWLRIDLNGGAAMVQSPAVPVASAFSYVLEARMKTSGLATDTAILSIEFFDQRNQPLDSFDSRPIGGTTDWTTVTVGPISSAHRAARYAVVSLRTQPHGAADLSGSVSIDDVVFARIPRMTVSTDRRHNVYTLPAAPQIRCEVSGFTAETPRVKFELFDVRRQPVAEVEKDIERISIATPLEEKERNKKNKQPAPAAGYATWKPPIEAAGFYSVRITVTEGAAAVHRREISLAAIRSAATPRGGEFGWTLPDGDSQLPLGDLADLASQSGINWLKFPLWAGADQGDRLDQWAWFAERLNLQGIELVGLLSRPPVAKSADKEAARTDKPLADRSAAEIFTGPAENWYTTLEPVITRMSLKVHYWQLGGDLDTSFTGYPKLPDTIEGLHARLARFGQQVYLGFGWRWTEESPVEKRPAWAFLNYSSDPPLTADELGGYLAARRTPGAKSWVVLQPLPQGEYSLDARARDLVERMVAAKREKADGIFVAQPLDDHSGLLRADGTPSELFLPWRTTALALAGAEYLGTMLLPGGSTNHLFARDGQAVMVVWNETPGTESLYLGAEAWQNDLWGGTTPVETVEGQHQFRVGPSPTIITGLNEAVMRMRLSFAFDRPQLASQFGRPQENGFKLTNHFKAGISGRARLITPDAWRTAPRETVFKLAPGETLHQPIEITLPYDATTGRQPVRVELEFTADRLYTFSLNRTFSIGGDEIAIELTTRTNEQGDIEVIQQFINNSDAAVSFRCQLFVPDRRRQVTQIIDQGRGVDRKIYRLPKASELTGKTLWLRAEEIAGQRVLNYRFVVGQ